MKTLMLAIAILFSVSAFGQSEKAEHFNLSDRKIALSGYDAVSYFNGDPVKGKSQYKAVDNNITYYFSNASNLKSFKENPGKYKPQYGGWCAYAMGKTGEKVEVNPKTFKILDDKLYLFYNKFFTNTLDTWNEDERNLKVKADKNWGDIIK
ncbi:YHS domain-containing (seleno)protein [Fulvivirgaceae bacterium BMA12]|uniref:YHS domain-containing (Seleno)protein n=1 Tax=Agaribacillus aureus TaxID=3051825 RepID=A0ABT8L5R1_9BACT|nr:YHS domain-containing (seleno)protein [Fulvivirgaceae bacterium BMA12]